MEKLGIYLKIATVCINFQSHHRLLLHMIMNCDKMKKIKIKT